MTKVKICGITNLDDALAASRFGADAVGFNFYKGSPRYVMPEKIRLIVDDLPEEVEKVGVFVKMEPDELLGIADATLLDLIQLHGDEDHDYIRTLRRRTHRRIMKAVRVRFGMTIDDIRVEQIDAVLLDAYDPNAYGGTGETFDWDIAAKLSAKVSQLYLAGGLNPSNVAEAIEKVRPYAVDVASGVESSPGIKDHEKMKAFIENAKRA